VDSGLELASMCPFPIAGREKNFKLVVGSGRANVPIARKSMLGRGLL
jgi:hypothetical protein